MFLRIHHCKAACNPLPYFRSHPFSPLNSAFTVVDTNLIESRLEWRGWWCSILLSLILLLCLNCGWRLVDPQPTCHKGRICWGGGFTPTISALGLQEACCGRVAAAGVNPCIGGTMRALLLVGLESTKDRLLYPDGCKSITSRLGNNILFCFAKEHVP